MTTNERTLLLRLAQLAREDAVIDAIQADAFGAQAEFVRSLTKRRAALCTRRAGKSRAGAKVLSRAMVRRPDLPALYIVQKGRSSAREIMGTALLAESQAHGLGFHTKEKDGQLWVEGPRGCRVWLAGCKDRAEIEKFRGLAYSAVVIDEAQTFPDYLRELIYDVIEPALLDADGELLLTGTAAPVPAGFFFDKTAGPPAQRWETHRWSVLDNPHIPRAKEWLAELMAANGWTEEHPTYIREYLGQWVLDAGALVYPFEVTRNGASPPSDGDWDYVLGVDLGYSPDATAFVLAGRRRHDPSVYVILAESHAKLIPSAVAAHIDRLRQGRRVGRIVVDTGGLGKGYAEEIRVRYGIPCEPAKKGDKRGFQEIVRGEFLSGRVQIDPWNCRELLDEILVLPWDTNDPTKEDGRYPNHCADAMLYAIRELRSGPLAAGTRFETHEEREQREQRQLKVQAQREVQRRLATESRLRLRSRRW